MGKPVSSKLLSLSPEVLIEIIFLLPARDIVACSRTCHLLHTLVLETQLLQYVIYTHCAAVDDRFPCGLTVPQRFAFLERWEEAWRDSDGLDPSGGRVKLMIPVDLKTQSMLRDGFLVVSHFKVEAEDEGIAGYSAIDLRSPSMVWRRTDIPCHIIAFDCSIEQNLVATLHVYVTPLITPCHRFSERMLEIFMRDLSDFCLPYGPSTTVLTVSWPNSVVLCFQFGRGGWRATRSI